MHMYILLLLLLLLICMHSFHINFIIISIFSDYECMQLIKAQQSSELHFETN